MSWRFYPLAECIRDGILKQDGGKPRVAAFFTPIELKAMALRQKDQARD